MIMLSRKNWDCSLCSGEIHSFVRIQPTEAYQNGTREQLRTLVELSVILPLLHIRRWTLQIIWITLFFLLLLLLLTSSSPLSKLYQDFYIIIKLIIFASLGFQSLMISYFFNRLAEHWARCSELMKRETLREWEIISSFSLLLTRLDKVWGDFEIDAHFRVLFEFN